MVLDDAFIEKSTQGVIDAYIGFVKQSMKEHEDRPCMFVEYHGENPPDVIHNKGKEYTFVPNTTHTEGVNASPDYVMYAMEMYAGTGIGRGLKCESVMIMLDGERCPAIIFSVDTENAESYRNYMRGGFKGNIKTHGKVVEAVLTANPENQVELYFEPTKENEFRVKPVKFGRWTVMRREDGTFRAPNTNMAKACIDHSGRESVREVLHECGIGIIFDEEKKKVTYHMLKSSEMTTEVPDVKLGNTATA